MARRLLLLVAVAATVALAAGPAAAATPNPPNDPRFPDQAGLSAIKAPEAWAKGTGGGVKVAVVSSGIAKDHPDLTAKTDGGFDTTGGQAATDSLGRGTHLAGIVGAATHNDRGIAGVAPDARLLPFKAFDSETGIDGAKFRSALQAVSASGAKVALVDVPAGYPEGDRAALVESLRALGAAGISVVVGARSGLALGGIPVLPVAGSAGEAGDRGVAAPASDVLSTTVTALTALPPRYEYGRESGNGQAAAHAAGAVAILRGLGATSAQAADILRSTKAADGMIDVAAAVGSYTAPKPPPPSSTTTTTKKPAAGATPPSTVPATGTGGTPAVGDTAGLTGPLEAEPVELGQGEEAVVPPGAEDFLDSGDQGGGLGTPGGDEDNRPLGLLAAGFGLLAGVGSGLSLTLRRLADAPI